MPDIYIASTVAMGGTGLKADLKRSSGFQHPALLVCDGFAEMVKEIRLMNEYIDFISGRPRRKEVIDVSLKTNLYNLPE